MRIQTFEAQGIRNLQAVRIDPSPGVNVIFGENGQGKTNLLEAIWLFTGMRSFRGAKDRDFIGFEEQRTSLSVSFQTAERVQTAALALQRDNIRDKRVFLNGVPLANPANLFGALRCVVFSPEHLSLVKEGPEERRRFLDSAVAQTRPSYLKLLRQYNRQLAQRNALLKAPYSGKPPVEAVDVWDRQLAKTGSYLSLMRLDYVERLAKAAGEYYAGISSGRERLELRYYSTVFCKRREPVSYTNGIIEYYYDRLHSRLNEDFRQGYTGLGIHRDDLHFFIGGRDARAFGSQGQQRSAVLALKLAESALLTAAFDEAPCILFDDVMSELDVGRQQFLMNNLEGLQVFITCCELAGLMRLAEGGRFSMENGVLTPV